VVTGFACPRCGRPVNYVERQRRGGRWYYYAAHYEGCDIVGGRVRKRVRKCYLGPEEYEYVTRTHGDLGVIFRGAINSTRIISYLDELLDNVDYINLNRHTAMEIIDRLERLVKRLKEKLELSSETSS
jgi:hypothetical protein